MRSTPRAAPATSRRSSSRRSRSSTTIDDDRRRRADVDDVRSRDYDAGSATSRRRRSRRPPTSDEPTESASRGRLMALFGRRTPSRRRWTASTSSSPTSTVSSTPAPARSRTRSRASIAPRRPPARLHHQQRVAHRCLGRRAPDANSVSRPRPTRWSRARRRRCGCSSSGSRRARRCSSSAATGSSTRSRRRASSSRAAPTTRRPPSCRASRPRSAGRSWPRPRSRSTLPEEEGGIPWIATNTDWTIPQARGIAPGNGTLVSAVHTAVGRLATVAGKPEVPIFDEAVARFGAQHPLFLGDRLDTDILGANRAGIPSALVLTGIDRPKHVLAAPAGLAADVHPRRPARAARAVPRGDGRATAS